MEMGKSTSSSSVGTGGMASKLNAAKLAGASGCDMVIANGKDFHVIHKIIAGEPCGTVFKANKKEDFYLMDEIERMF